MITVNYMDPLTIYTICVIKTNIDLLIVVEPVSHFMDRTDPIYTRTVVPCSNATHKNGESRNNVWNLIN